MGGPPPRSRRRPRCRRRRKIAEEARFRVRRRLHQLAHARHTDRALRHGGARLPLAAPHQELEAQRATLRGAHGEEQENDREHLRRGPAQDLAPQLRRASPRRLLLLQTLSWQRLPPGKIHQGHALLPDRDAVPQRPGRTVPNAPQVPQGRIPQDVHGPIHTLLHRKDRAGGGRQGQAGPHRQPRERHTRHTDASLRHTPREHERTAPSQRSAAGVQRQEKVHHTP
mmetsp:Transcript_9166/g.20241  ORF Transcript_9166/g.20241 Transcript_9166/m.20241 type:complete len:226 (+) Transcript_9166:897-1574(+)